MRIFGPAYLHGVIVVLLVGLVTFSIGAKAGSLSVKDVQIIIKVLGFLDPPISDGIVAVVYASGNPASRADAMEIVVAFGGGLKLGGNTIVATAVDAASLGDGHHYVAVIAAAGAPAEQIMTTTRALRIPCVTGDTAQVEAGHCTVAVHSAPKVDIVLNHEVALSAGISFAVAFRMLVHEI